MTAMESTEKLESPFADSTSSTESGLLNRFTGLLSKAADTALDVYALKESRKTIGTAYPTGQSDPATVQSTELAEKQSNSATQMTRYMPWIIGGGVVIVLLIGGVALISARKS